MRSSTPLNKSIRLARRAPAFTVVAVLAALAAGCGSSTPPNAAAQQSASTPGAEAFKYSRCMRVHGVSDFPDPQVSSHGSSASIRQVAPASAIASPQFKSAQKACQGLEPGPGNTTAGTQGPQPQVLLAFAHCLHGHGLS